MDVVTVADIDLTRAKAAVRALNETNPDTAVVYRIARVVRDAEPPLGMIVDVFASALPGERLPDPPDPGPSPNDVYVPPEERGGAFGGVLVETHVGSVEVKADVPLDLVVIGEEVGEHAFPSNPSLPAVCLDCGCSLEWASEHRRCPS